jgi:hypothetical protein
MARRKKIPINVQLLVLHEAGFRCAVPTCRTLLTIDLHHMTQVSEGGGDTPDNLLALCKNCHALHHLGKIPMDSIRAWKFLLLSLNEAFDRRAIDLMLLFDQLGSFSVQADSLFAFPSLAASGFLDLRRADHHSYFVSLSDKGKFFVDAWKRGDQKAAIEGSDSQAG